MSYDDSGKPQGPADTAKKGIAALIVSRMKPSDKDGPEANDNTDGEEYDESKTEGKMVCCEEMMQAVTDQDPHAFMKALDSYLAHR